MFTETICLLKSVPYVVVQPHLNYFAVIHIHRTYQVNEVCGHSAVWVPDSNALWSPNVFGSFS